MTDFFGTAGVLGEIAGERLAQDEKWGEQNHPMHKSPELAAIPNTVLANLWKANNDSRVEEGALAWDGILLEEVYEALAETDPAKQREELIQVAAVAVAAIECLDRRAAE